FHRTRHEIVFEWRLHEHSIVGGAQNEPIARAINRVQAWRDPAFLAEVIKEIEANAARERPIGPRNVVLRIGRNSFARYTGIDGTEWMARRFRNIIRE